ncbi:restriction endonuclease [Enterococcus sp. 5H]|uniref:restriction endonuclease n=1 Tax=Enterococcus sp. 5H TaxID=1229490 RepID=UPI0023028A77|nr:restriction endonuclease [Enterococcus sp. 5H]MDA9470050.1 hypothetical protein [Enterococcus sp. 5H]
MNNDLTKLIEAAKTNPSIFKREYTFTEEQALQIDKLIIQILEDKFETTKSKGDALESLVDYIFSSHNIYKVRRNLKTSTNEIDVFLELEFFGDQVNQTIEKSLLENEVLVECKNYNSKADVTWIGKFASLLRVSNTKVGLFISKRGITGRSKWQDGKGLIKKIALRDNNLILDFELADFMNLKGKTLFECLRTKVQSLELDIDIESLIETHDLESKL